MDLTAIPPPHSHSHLRPPTGRSRDTRLDLAQALSLSPKRSSTASSLSIALALADPMPQYPADEAVARLEGALREGIPLCAHMGLRITALTADPFHIELQAPLAPNINVHGTAFAGSLYSLATLGAWGLVDHFLRTRFPGTAHSHVMKEASIKYLRPVQGDLTCHCDLPAPEAVAEFVRALEDRGRGRLAVTATVQYAGEAAAVLEAVFSARRPQAPAPEPALEPGPPQ